MSNPSRHVGKVHEHSGRLVLRNPEAWAATVARHKGHEVWISIARAERRPTFDQHAYYRAGILPLLAEEWGWDDRDELHFRLKEKHIPTELWVERRFGTAVERIPPSCADLTKDQFSAFLTAVMVQAAHSGIVVPEPRP